MAQIFAGFFAEGTTDYRFLIPIIEKTLTEIAFDECNGQHDIVLMPLNIERTGLDFGEQISNVAKKGITEFGMTLLCVHLDADDEDANNAYSNRFEPAINIIRARDPNEYCQIIVAVVPIQETEAWMLADTELLKREIGTNLSETDLGFHRPPQSIARPKEVIEEALRIVQRVSGRRRRKDLTIADLYAPIGQKIETLSLEALSSFLEFKENVREAFRALHILH